VSEQVIGVLARAGTVASETDFAGPGFVGRSTAAFRLLLVVRSEYVVGRKDGYGSGRRCRRRVLLAARSEAAAAAAGMLLSR
jgi:hypothetical protein